MAPEEEYERDEDGIPVKLIENKRSSIVKDMTAKEVSGETIACIIADKFPEIFDMEGQDYDKLNRLEELGNEIAKAI